MRAGKVDIFLGFLCGILFSVVGGALFVVVINQTIKLVATRTTADEYFYVLALLGTIFPILGLKVLIDSVRSLREQKWIRKNGIPALGRIIEKTLSSTSVNNYCYRVVHVQMPDGNVIKSAPFDDRNLLWEVGDLITVLIHPADPTQGLVDLNPVVVDRWKSG